MKARIQWAGEAMFLGESDSGHVVVMDGPPESGGRNLGVRPMEMVLIGLGGCSNFDVVSILKSRANLLKAARHFSMPNVPMKTRKCLPKFICTSSSKDED